MDTNIKSKNGETLKVELSDYKGQKYVNIRFWYEDKDGEMKPTQKGVTFRADQFEEFENAINSIKEELGQ